MKLTDEVMNDLLTLYLAGEASADSKALVESHARQNPAFASKVAAAGALPMGMPQVAPPSDLELRTLTETRRFIFLRTLFLACAILFTLLPLVFSFDKRGVEFLVLGRHPELVWSFWSVAAAAWTAFHVMHRQVRPVGL
ncbi:MAG: hypothetical protein ABJC89_08535 [Acidobacteriota bacterium]